MHWRFCDKTSKHDNILFENMNLEYVSSKVGNIEHFLCLCEVKIQRNTKKINLNCHLCMWAIKWRSKHFCVWDIMVLYKGDSGRTILKKIYQTRDPENHKRHIPSKPMLCTAALYCWPNEWHSLRSVTLQCFLVLFQIWNNKILFHLFQILVSFAN